MTDPNVRHIVCPVCHTHQLMLSDGCINQHLINSVPCPGAGPLRKQAGVRDATNMFASCPAATGEARCTGFPDGAHRCALERNHITPQKVEHVCTCGTVWFGYMGTMDHLVRLVNGQPR